MMNQLSQQQQQLQSGQSPLLQQQLSGMPVSTVLCILTVYPVPIFYMEHSKSGQSPLLQHQLSGMPVSTVLYTVILTVYPVPLFYMHRSIRPRIFLTMTMTKTKNLLLKPEEARKN
jgi:uncharacterized membrane protein (DUF106 family)